MKGLFTRDNLSIISLIVSVIALCVAYFRCKPLEANWPGILVGILSVLVTVLIGWNISSLLDIKALAKEMEKRMKESKENEFQLGASMHSSLANIHSSQFELVKGHEYFFLINETRSIMFNSYLKNYEKCSQHIKDIFKYRSYFQNLKLKDCEKECLFSSIVQVVNQDKIYQWDELVSFYKKLGVLSDKK